MKDSYAKGFSVSFDDVTSEKLEELQKRTDHNIDAYNQRIKGVRRDFFEQYDQFCQLRYEFFSESEGFRKIKLIEDDLIGSKNGYFPSDLIGLAKAQGLESLAERYFGYQQFGTVYIASDAGGVIKHYKEINVKLGPIKSSSQIYEITLDPSLPFEVFEEQIERIKEAAKAYYSKSAQTKHAAYREMSDFLRDAANRKRKGGQLPFDRWTNCLVVYRKYKSQSHKNKAQISREMGWFNPIYRSHCTEEITKLLKEAERLIKSAEEGNFPN